MRTAPIRTVLLVEVANSISEQFARESNLWIDQVEA
jgi:hypothetical protein